MATFEDIEDAFFFVSSEAYGMNRALLCLDSGEIYYHLEIDDLNELDEENFDCDNFLEIPHKNDLGLGFVLAREFAQLRMPEETAQVDRIFRSSGAYRDSRSFSAARDCCRAGMISRINGCMRPCGNGAGKMASILRWGAREF